MRRALFVILGLLVVGGSRVNAQNPGPARAAPQLPSAPGEILGTGGATEANTPVSRASIAIRAKADSSLVAGAIAGTDGAFRIQGLRPGAYYVRVTSIGYAPKTQVVTIAPTSPRVELGSIALSRIAVTLQGVEVTADRPVISIEPDRNSYRAKDVAPAAANASDVLEAVPAVQVDADGKVSFRGNENVAIQINGRPAPMRGPQLGSFLKQLPANIVEKVEVIPNPSAKYDPEGMAGIINIVLKANADLGVSGGVTVSGANSDRFNTSGNVGYQSGPLTTFTSYGYNSDDRGLSGINDRERMTALGAPQSFTEQDIVGQNGNGGHNFTTTADYKLNKRDVLTNSLVINRRRNTDESVSSYTELSGSRSVLDQYDRLKDTKSTSLLFDYTLAFKRSFEPRKHELSTELRYNRSDDEDQTSLWRESFAPSNGARTDAELDHTDALTQQLNAQLDYTRPLGKRSKLESGYKGTGRWLDRDYLVLKDALGTGLWVRSDLSNNFQFDEQVQAAYGVLSQGVGKWDLQAGLRTEYASRNFSLEIPAQDYPYHYTSVFPSGVALYKLSDATQLKASYSRRIRRPGTQELNPFPSFFDVQNVFIGNPRLNPEYTDAFEFGYNTSGKLGTLQVSPFYRHTTDVLRVVINTSDTIDSRPVTSVSFQNLATSDSWGTDVNGSFKPAKWLSGLAGFNIFKIVTDGGSESALTSDAVTWAARINATAQLSKTLTLQAAHFYRAPQKFEQGQFSAFRFTNISLRQKFMNDKATVSLRFVDPFNTNGFKVRVSNGDVIQVTERKFGVRGTFLTFQYNFGQAPKIRVPRPEDQQTAPAFPSG